MRTALHRSPPRVARTFLSALRWLASRGYICASRLGGAGRNARATRGAFLVLLLALPATARPLTFSEILAMAQQAHAVPASATAAATALELPPMRLLPTVRAETAITRGSNVDIFTTNIFRADAVTTLLSLDYPLLDGGMRAAEEREAKLDAAAFRTRMRAASDDLFRRTVEATAQLYAAQEKLKVLRAGLDRAVGLRERAGNLLASHEISNTIAAQWEDDALQARSQMLDLDLQRLEAETRLKQLIGDTSPQPIDVVLDLDSVPSPASVTDRSDLAIERKNLAVAEAEAAARPQLMMSAFGGVAAVADSPHYGLYGLRFSLALPSFDAAAKRRIAVAKLDAEQAKLDRVSADEARTREESALTLAIAATEKRIELLRSAVDVARQREQSVSRLASAGVRSENALAEVAFELTRRESDLIAAQVDLWKYRQLLGRGR